MVGRFDDDVVNTSRIVDVFEVDVTRESLAEEGVAFVITPVDADCVRSGATGHHDRPGQGSARVSALPGVITGQCHAGAELGVGGIVKGN